MFKLQRKLCRKVIVRRNEFSHQLIMNDGYKGKETPAASCLTIETEHSTERTSQMSTPQPNITPFDFSNAKLCHALTPSQRRRDRMPND